MPMILSEPQTGRLFIDKDSNSSASIKKDTLRASTDSISRRAEFLVTFNTLSSTGTASASSPKMHSPNSMSAPHLPPLEITNTSASTIVNGAPITSSPKSESPRKLSLDTFLPQHSPPFSSPLASSVLSASANNDSNYSNKVNAPRNAPEDGGLKVPLLNSLSHHRLSSPPRLPHPSSPSQHSSTYPFPIETPKRPPAIHRHTLEVPPRVSTSPRTSKDNPPGSARSEDAVYMNGSLSPHGRSPRKHSLSISRWTPHPRSNFDSLHYTTDDGAGTPIEEQRRRMMMMRRRRRDDEEDDRVIVGTKVDQNHVNWITAYNMLTGIRFVVSRTNAKMKPKEIKDSHYTAQNKFSFDVTGNELTPSAKYDFKFKDYAPEVFRDLRDTFGLDPGDYLVSLTSKYILSELGSPGKSGSFFYFSRDYKYIIKTIHHSEHVLLRKVLKQYHHHVKSNPNTLLSQFYGLHRVKVAYGKKIHFVVMNNLFPPHRDIHRTFDLKGSTIGRDFREEDLETEPRAVLKDLNWLRRKLHFEFGPAKKSMFINQMEKDVALLKSLKIMDYSLLVGIHDLGKGNEENLRDRTLQVFQPGGDTVEANPSTNLTNHIEPLLRTPSKLETMRKAKELRQNLKTQRPIPLGSSTSRMPDILSEDEYSRRNGVFYQEDGGFMATHNDDSPGEEIYYLGIIDCLTKYSLKKRSEHFFKGITQNEAKISAIPPERYGDRFVNFISRVTLPRETQTEKEKPSSDIKGEAPDRERKTVDVKGSSESARRNSKEANNPLSAGAAERASTDEKADSAGATLPVVEEAPGEISSNEEPGSTSATRNKDEKGKQKQQA